MFQRKRAAFFTVLWIAVMVIIFSFSNDDAGASSAKSGAVVVIVETVEELLDLTPTQEVRAMTEWFVRKCAHVFLYTCLAVTGMLAVREYVRPVLTRSRSGRKEKEQRDGLGQKNTGGSTVNIRKGILRPVTALITYLLCFLYACTDEWHQTFRSGRSGSFRDVMIDSIGMVLGIAIVTLIWVLWDRFHKKTEGENWDEADSSGYGRNAAEG